MWYLLLAIVAWLAGSAWMWWAARHAPILYDGEVTHPPRRHLRAVDLPGDR